MVFLLCGFWHGASWTFIVWGFFHGLFLVFERTRFGMVIAAGPVILRRLYALCVVLIGWVFFRAETLPAAIGYLLAMAGIGSAAATAARPVYDLTIEVQIALIIGVILALRPFPSHVSRFALSPAAVRAPQAIVQFAVLALSLLYVAAGTYNPFIYFRF